MNANKSSNQAEKVWLVTGCSTGFGRNLVAAILARGDKVVATARRIYDLDYIQGTEHAKALQLDVTTSEEILRQKAGEAIREFGRIDVLVNNAGYVSSGVWEEVSLEETLRQFETNVFGALKLAKCLLPHMRSRRSGTILFMSSISAWHGVGAGGPYSSSKFALEGAVECLQKETSHLGIKSHLLVIGQFRTSILTAEKKSDTLDKPGIADYNAIKQELAERHAITNGSQPGDPALAVQRILDIARGENLTSEQAANLPLRIPLGSDAVDVVRKKCRETLKVMDEWEDFASSCDFPATETVPSYYQE